jgi:hypothetical protein
MYVEAWTIVEGALDAERTFPTRPKAVEWLETEINACQAEGVQADGYILTHPHAEGVECECSQFVTDHNPYLSTA